MARKTKAEAEQTRQRILEAARGEFLVHGVSRTSLERIAAAAGVTRGAIYWHFANKTVLFQAMRDQVSLPLFDRMEHDLPGGTDPLAGVEHFLLESMEQLTRQREVGEIFEILTTKCEYVEEMAPVLAQFPRIGQEMVARLNGAYVQAQALGLLREGGSPPLLALESFLFFVGMVRVWVSDREGILLRPHLREVVAAHVAARRKG